MPHQLTDNHYLWIGTFTSKIYGYEKVQGKLEFVLPVKLQDFEKYSYGYITFTGSYMKNSRRRLILKLSSDNSSIIASFTPHQNLNNKDKDIIFKINQIRDIKMQGLYQSSAPGDSGVFVLEITLNRELSSSEIYAV